MRRLPFFLLIVWFITPPVHSQNLSFDTLFQRGRSEFFKEDKQNYKLAAEYLEKAVKLRPNDAQAHYFLGYAYSRLNAEDGASMVDMQLMTTYKCSAEFETVNKLTPKYTGEILILDPYSKLTAEWGSMAMSYWHNNKPDSALWAFAEGKKRGGFGEFLLSLNRAVLEKCSKDAILMSSGDNNTIPLWYLQIVEGSRKDVSVIDISLLNAKWYPSLLLKKGIVQFDVPDKIISTIEYCEWKDSTITINGFSWILKPSYEKNYLLRSNRLFLSILNANQFKRDVYTTTGMYDGDLLNLENHFQDLLLIYKLNTKPFPKMNYEEFKSEITKIFQLNNKINLNSVEEIYTIDNFRYSVAVKVTEFIEEDKKEEAKELMRIMDQYANEIKFPYRHTENQKYSDYLRSKLK
jgi:hypothetical protein